MAPAVPIIAAVAGAAASYGAGVALATIGITGFAASLISGFAGLAVSFAVSALGGALAGSGKKQGSSVAQSLSGRTQSFREAASPHRYVIGRVRVGGPMIFVHARDADGVKAKYRYQVFVLAAHQCAALSELYFNDTLADDPKFKGLWRYEFKRGLPDQTAPDWFVEETEGKWTTAHRGQGRALLYVRTIKDETAFPGGLPNVSAVIRGKELFDPRSGASAYSANAALAVLDYLRGEQGLREPADGWDEDTAIAAANICDELVPLAAGGTQKRYEAHGTYTLDEQPADVLAKLLSASAGTASYAGGRWFIEPAAWRPSNRVITQHQLRGPISVAHNRPFRDLFNGVRATYVRPDADWQETDAPVLLSDSAVMQDGGEPVYQALELPFTTNGIRAQRLMQIALRRNRAQRSITLDTMLHHLALRPGATFTFDMPRQARQTFRTTSWALAPDGGGVSLTAEADDPSIYAWNPATDEQPLKPVGLATEASAAAALTPVLTLTPPTAPLPATIAASWTAVSGALDYELLWRITPTGEFTSTTQAGTSATISTGARAEMKVRARREEGFSEYDVAGFPPLLTRFVVAGAPGGLIVEHSGSDAAQIFAGATDVFADATLASSPTAAGGTMVSLAAGTWFVWARAVGAKGAVGAELGPIEAIAEDPASGGSTGSDAGGGGTGETEGPGSGGPSGGSAGAG
jgi:hypothetical protein